MHRPRAALSIIVALALLKPCPSWARDTPAVDDEPRRARSLRVAGGVLMGAGAVLMLPMGIATVEYRRSTSEIWRLVEFAEAEQRRFTPREFLVVTDERAHLNRMRSVAIATGVTGGVCLIAGLTLVLHGARPRGEPREARVDVAPALGPGHAGVWVHGRF